MAFTSVSVPYISADIYKTGIKTNILDANGGSNTRLCVCLLGSNFSILAYSAILSCSNQPSSAAETSEGATNYNAEFKWNNKTLTIPVIPYTVTKNISTIASGGATASYFAVIKLTKQEGGGDEAFKGSGYYQFPSEVGLNGLDNDNLLIVGNISSTPTINSNSNFRLTETTITFSETSAS